MNETPKEVKPKRSKVMRFILIAIALAFFWSSRYQLAFDLEKGQLVRYHKWTERIDVRAIPGS